MKAVVTITSRNYLLYTHRLICSIREAEWRGKIIVFTPDESIKLNCEMRYIRKPVVQASQRLNDARWLKAEILNTFSNGDHIIYSDSDGILLRGFERLFDYRFGATWVKHDPTGELNEMKSLLPGKKINGKCSDSLLVINVSDFAKTFFAAWRAAMWESARRARGTMFAFNLACVLSGYKPDQIPREWVYFTVDQKEKQGMAHDVISFQYGGKRGKENWKKDNEGEWNNEILYFDHLL